MPTDGEHLVSNFKVFGHFLSNAFCSGNPPSSLTNQSQFWIKRKKKIKVKAGICSFYRTHPGSQVSLGSDIVGRGQKTSTFHEERPVQRYDRLKLKLKCKFQVYLYKLPPRQVPRRPSFVHNWPAFKFAPRVPFLPLQIIADIWKNHFWQSGKLKKKIFDNLENFTVATRLAVCSPLGRRQSCQNCPTHRWPN